MQFSTASSHTKRDLKQTSISMLVSLFLILLTIFVILSNGSSYDHNKQQAVKQSIEDTFSKKKKDAVIFGRLTYLKLDDHALELEKAVKKYGTITTNNDEDKLRITIPLSAIYYSDEPSFLSTSIADMMLLVSILKNWSDTETVHINVSLSETTPEQDEQRLNFFHKYIQGERPQIGIKISKEKTLDIIVERTS